MAASAFSVSARVSGAVLVFARLPLPGRLPWQPSGGQLPPSVLVPAAALAEAARAAVDDPVSLHVLTGDDGTPAVAGFGCGDQAITTRLAAGEYPDIARMIPAGFSAVVIVDAGELAEAVKRLAVVAARGTPVRLAITRGQIELATGSGEEADGTDTIGCAGRRPAHRRLLSQPPAGRHHLHRHRPRPHRPDNPSQGRADHSHRGRRLGRRRPARLPAPAHAHPQRRLTRHPAHPIAEQETIHHVRRRYHLDDHREPDRRSRAAVTATGTAVAAFTVAASRRVYDQTAGQWQDGDTLFLRCSAWRELADHAAESLSKGMRVIVTGRLKQRQYETPEGDKRTVYEVDADDIGPSLKWATAKIAKTNRDKVPHPAGSGDPWQDGTAPDADDDRPPF